ncbi:MAG: PadR family transcriptional regulator [Halobacteria archaeon]|nr:PadR family transcriptional regulator [Halobacteria archaeon]
MRDLTAFQRKIVQVLAEESMYGLAIKRELENYYGDEVNHGRLYPNLDELVELGYLRKNELDKRTNEYELTEKGAERLADEMRWEIERYVRGDGNLDDVDSLLPDGIEVEAEVETHDA